jgi:hypothetical protein
MSLSLTRFTTPSTALVLLAPLLTVAVAAQPHTASREPLAGKMLQSIAITNVTVIDGAGNGCLPVSTVIAEQVVANRTSRRLLDLAGSGKTPTRSRGWSRRRPQGSVVSAQKQSPLRGRVHLHVD